MTKNKVIDTERSQGQVIQPQVKKINQPLSEDKTHVLFCKDCFIKANSMSEWSDPLLKKLNKCLYNNVDLYMSAKQYQRKNLRVEEEFHRNHKDQA